MPATRLALASRDRNIKMRPELVNGERFAHHVNHSKSIENLAEPRRLNLINFQVPILRLPAHLLVGGCVRDELMGRQPKDWDLEVYEVEPARLREILDRFGMVNVVGEAFTVYKLGPHLDISIPRRERKTGRGHRAFFIEGDSSMSTEEATSRRDFTVNSILQDPLTSEIIDPFDGAKDIEAKILRAVSPKTFSEDSLRVLR